MVSGEVGPHRDRELEARDPVLAEGVRRYLHHGVGQPGAAHACQQFLHAEHPAGLTQLPFLLRAHALWASLGLPIDLVVLCGEAVPPGQGLADGLLPEPLPDGGAGDSVFGEVLRRRWPA